MEATAKNHILIAYATRRPYKDAPDMPPDAVYDERRGYWLSNGEPLVLTMGGTVTKKCDQETGEDQKGQ